MFRNGEVRTTGEAVRNFMPPMSVFDPRRNDKKRIVIGRIRKFFEKYRGV